jgi:hypothetical protein
VRWLVLVLIVFTFGSQARADHKICIGQFKSNCPSQPVDGYYSCDYDQKKAAQEVCTLYKETGAVKLGYQIIHVETKDAKECKYEVFRVVCENEK